MLGRFSDYVIANGGTTVLTEVPEMFGAEQLLMSHCRDEATFDKLVTMVNDFKQYFIAHDQPIYENPRRVIRPEGSLPSKISRWAVLRKRAPARWWMFCATASA